MPHGDIGPALLMLTIIIIAGLTAVCASVAAIATVARLMIYKRRITRLTSIKGEPGNARSSGPATTALILGILSLVIFLPICVPAVIYAQIALRRMEQQGHDRDCHKRAVVGFATGVFGITLLLILAGAYIYFCIL